MEVQEAQRTPNRYDQKKDSPWYILIKTLNLYNEERLLKDGRKWGPIHIQRETY